jgi:hypothetical protein
MTLVPDMETYRSNLGSVSPDMSPCREGDVAACEEHA